MRAEEAPAASGAAGGARRARLQALPGSRLRLMAGGTIHRSSRFGWPADKLPAAEEEGGNHVRDDFESTQ